MNSASLRKHVVSRADGPIAEILASTLKGLWLKDGQKPRLGLAISGGVDSMALASLCVAAKARASVTGDFTPGLSFRKISGPRLTAPLSGPSFTAFIVDHKIRPQSTREATNVSMELAKVGIKSRILELDWTSYGDPTSLPNIETVTRWLRFQALGRACKQEGISSLLVAHHRDDQAETVLFRILAKYGGMGLRGIKTEAAIPDCDGIYGVDNSGNDPNTEATRPRAWISTPGMAIECGGVTIARPLLAFDKEQLVSTCQQNGVRWFEDHTNADVTMTLRNTVRSLLKSDVLPKALRKDRLLALASRKDTERRAIEEASSKVLRQMKIALDARCGEATLAIPRQLEDDTVKGSMLSATLMRKMIRLINPIQNVALRDLDQAVEHVFGGGPVLDPSQPRQGVQVAGVVIQQEAATGPKVNRVRIHRALPSQREKSILQTVLCRFDENSDTELTTWTEWQLWDARYWIRIQPPPVIDAWLAEVRVRFLTVEDIVALRGSQESDRGKQLKLALDLARGSKRYTCPALVAVTRTDGPELVERVVALPTLDWSDVGWGRWNGKPSGQHWSWEVRFKHIESPDLNVDSTG